MKVFHTNDCSSTDFDALLFLCSPREEQGEEENKARRQTTKPKPPPTPRATWGRILIAVPRRRFFVSASQEAVLCVSVPWRSRAGGRGRGKTNLGTCFAKNCGRGRPALLDGDRLFLGILLEFTHRQLSSNGLINPIVICCVRGN